VETSTAALKLESSVAALEFETDATTLKLETETDVSQEISMQESYSAD
jgi:hypothetical protein